MPCRRHADATLPLTPIACLRRRVTITPPPLILFKRSAHMLRTIARRRAHAVDCYDAAHVDDARCHAARYAISDITRFSTLMRTDCFVLRCCHER